MNKDQIEAFNIFWEELISNCKVTFPEVVDILELERRIVIRGIFSKEPISKQRSAWVNTMNAVIQLMQVVNLEDDLWVKAIIFRWIWDWELKNEQQ